MRLQVILKVKAKGKESDTGSGGLLGTDHRRYQRKWQIGMLCN